MFEDLKYTIYEFDYVSLQDVVFNPFHGSMLRGLLGNALRSILCAEKAHALCETCNLQSKCLYIRLFYGIDNDTASTRKLNTYKLPNPYVIRPLMQGVTELSRGDSYKFQLVLIGEETIRFSMYYVMAANEITKYGFQKADYRFKLVKITDAVEKSILNYSQLLDPRNINIYNVNPQELTSVTYCTVKLITPLRVQTNGKFVNNLTFEIFIKSALRRISMLSEIYAQTTKEIDYKSLLELARNIECIDQCTKWVQLERYSTYKDQDISIGGLQGHIVFSGDFKPFSELLNWSRIVNVGKSCTNGDGWIDYEFT